MNFPVLDNIIFSSQNRFDRYTVTPVLWAGPQIVLRLFLVLGIARWLPHPLFLTDQLWQLLLLLFAGLSTLTGVWQLWRPATALSSHLLLSLDLLGACTAIINDPSPWQPTMALWFAIPCLQIWSRPAEVSGRWIPLGTSALLLSLWVKRLLLQTTFSSHGMILLALVLGNTLLFWSTAIVLQQILDADAFAEKPDARTHLPRRSSLYAAARYFFPYQQRTLIPIVLMCLELNSESSSGYLIEQLAQLLTTRIRSSDVAVRFDRHTLVVLLIDCAPVSAEKIAHDVNAEYSKTTAPVTDSLQIGIMTVPTTPVALDQLLLTTRQAIRRARLSPKHVGNIVFAEASLAPRR